jgi:hypothetical protein
MFRLLAGHHLSSPPMLLNREVISGSPSPLSGLLQFPQQHKRAGDASVPSPTCGFQTAKANAESMIT